MNGESQWLYPATPVQEVLRMRPRSLGLLETAGSDLWSCLHQGVGDFCARHGLDFHRFAADLAALPVPPHGTDWANAPLVDLLDRLGEDHRWFNGRILPAIGRVLSDSYDGDTESLQRLQILAHQWPAFAHALSEHLREEEEVLFLRILRYDSVSRMGYPDPEFEGGSVRVFSTIRMLKNGHRDQALLRDFIDRFVPECGDEDRPSLLMKALRPLLEDFQARLALHARLESLHLIPRAASLERALYDLRISGRA